ncbi:proline-rich protein 18 [Canis lupus familiaris]|uniref:proline-rich protein 18 n=1 Tax=Canis lupus familiaris TaxID=9615 RepID=UPI0015F1A260|nr:proline-rich protein 18 [Canis lupus familiaris]XP_038381417.1 proline-rich protein 18 [Canis lupus familiaris]XP_038509523.1 proline-rich protein 18 [Canis lupus familiaris]
MPLPPVPPAPAAPAARPPSRRPPRAPPLPAPLPAARRRPPEAPRSAPAPAALRFPLSLTPEAVLLLQGRHLQKPLLAPPARPRPSAPPPRAALPVSLLNERHRYDDVEYEDEEAPPRDDGLVRRCTEWLRGVEAAARARDRAGPLDALPHLSTL